MKKRIISIVAVILVVAMMSVVLVACAPKTMDDAKAKLTDKGYTVIPTPVVMGVGVLVATNNENPEYTVTAMFVENKDKLDSEYKKAEADLKTMKDKKNQAIKDLKNEIKNCEDKEQKAKLQESLKEAEDAVNSYTIKKSGNWIAIGHKKAIGALL